MYPQYDYDINERNIELQTEEDIVIKIKTINLHVNLLKNKNELNKELQSIIKN